MAKPGGKPAETFKYIHERPVFKQVPFTEQGGQKKFLH
ncbi:hypothetical protein Q7C_1956 [Methylophaga frappieri]|uniref:Uncharacterized protein n=1 Tax=Methylophaga frappieri (strain ATCC BAA-2434 / DSM 25690 / JAM7) TaxID=754477 RepID=I1YJK3_METFJ|nr:hypothetical protein Q7C_1956 [Methylophaga frappieri]